MKRFIPTSLKDLIKSFITDSYDSNPYCAESYSQEGEDLILNRYFEGKKTGFFIDIGAHHPIRFSNTYLFYQKGWRGINIDAMPESMIEFNRLRPEDTNIEQAIGATEDEALFHIFNEPALNTFDPNEAKNILNIEKYSLIETKSLSVKPLYNVLQNQNITQPIDFMSIDVEGLDLEVLKGNDWNTYRPELLLIELLNFNISEASTHETVIFLNNMGYVLFAKTFNTVFFKKIR